MPELPEVEVTRRGIAPELLGRTVSSVCVRTPKLRYPIPDHLTETLLGLRLQAVNRRGKYLLLDFSCGTLLIHLGMSGSLRVLQISDVAPQSAQKHDHFDLVFGDRVLRLRDPRRFGALLWQEASQPIEQHPLLAVLGLEPLSDEFTPRWMFAVTRGKAAPIKPFLMDGHVLVGVGNIYASESLFRAGIDPRTSAGKISLRRYERLVPEIRATLTAAIAAGGSSLRDFIQADGRAGYFQQQYFVYGRTGEACRLCGHTIQMLRQAQRASFYCARCQRC